MSLPNACDGWTGAFGFGWLTSSPHTQRHAYVIAPSERDGYRLADGALNETRTFATAAQAQAALDARRRELNLWRVWWRVSPTDDTTLELVHRNFVDARFRMLFDNAPTAHNVALSRPWTPKSTQRGYVAISYCMKRTTTAQQSVVAAYALKWRRVTHIDDTNRLDNRLRNLRDAGHGATQKYAAARQHVAKRRALQADEQSSRKRQTRHNE